MQYHYIGNNTKLPADLIEGMTENAKETSFNALYSKVGSNELRAVFPFYSWSRSKKVLAMHQDKHLRYYRSRYRQQKCYFVVHSAVKYVFVE